jgi:hypothetical protein
MSILPGKLASIVVITRDRPGALVRVIESHVRAKKISNAQELTMTVVDDSTTPSVAAKNAQIAKEVLDHREIPAKYVGLEERKRFVSDLTAFGLPRDVLSFGLLRDRSGIKAPGANRNASLLASPGKLFMSVDDDTEGMCMELANDDGDTDFAVTTDHSSDPIAPCELLSFIDREALVSRLSVADCGALQLHGQLLGKTIVQDSVASSCLDGSLVPNQWRTDLLGKRIVVTLNGLAGDCGWGTSSNFLWFRGASLARLTHSESHYKMACSSRIVFRAARRIELATGCSNMMGTFFAVDNRELLPPFPPGGCGEDLVFGRLVSACVPNACFAHLPQALIHSPVEPRCFDPKDIFMAAFGIDLCILLVAILKAMPDEQAMSNPEADRRVVAVGEHLERVGALPAEEANSYIREQVLRLTEHHFSSLKDHADSYVATAQAWRSDALGICELQKVTRESVGYHLPVEFSSGRKYLLALEQTRTYLRSYGRLLQYWPGIVRASLELEEIGLGLARKLN